MAKKFDGIEKSEHTKRLAIGTSKSTPYAQRRTAVGRTKSPPGPLQKGRTVTKAKTDDSRAEVKPRVKSVEEKPPKRHTITTPVEPIVLTIRPLHGDPFKVPSDTGSRILDLKKQVEHLKPELVASRHNVFVSGVMLAETHTVKESGITEDDMVWLTPKLHEHTRLGGHPTPDDRKLQLYEGWLQKRGARFGYKWQRVWCVLCPQKMLYYTDDNCWEKKGDVILDKLAKAMSLSASGAPGDAQKHCSERPHGFVLDPDPEAGDGRQFLYFDAEDPLSLRTWIQTLFVAAGHDGTSNPTLIGFDQQRRSRGLSVSEDGLCASIMSQSSAFTGLFSSWRTTESESHEIVFGNAPVAWFMEGAYYELLVKETRSGYTDGLTVGVASRLPNAGAELPKWASEIPKSWTVGYSGFATCKGPQDLVPNKWLSRNLKAGDRVGILVNCHGEVWVLQNGKMIDNAPGKAPVSSPLYAVVALMGNTCAVALIPEAAPPSEALIAQADCDNVAGTLMTAAKQFLASTGENFDAAYRQLCGAGFAKDDVERCLHATTQLRGQAATKIQKVAKGAMTRTDWLYSGLKAFLGGNVQPTIFQVQLDRGWVALDPCICAELDAAEASCIECVEYSHDGKLYRADLTKMEQVNVKTGRKHLLRRVAGGAETDGFPAHWTTEMPEEGWALVPLHDGNDPATFKILQKVLETDGSQLGTGADVQEKGTHSSLCLKCAWRIENHNLWTRYFAERSTVRSDMKQKNVGPSNRNHARGRVQDVTRSLPGNLWQEVTEVRLLHGTVPDKVLSLLRNGPNERFSRKGMFGDGTYLAEDAGKTDQYVRRDRGVPTDPDLEELHFRLFSKSTDHPGDLFYVFLCRVILGHFVRTKENGAGAKDMDFNRPVHATPTMRELAAIPLTTPPIHYHSLIAEVGFKILRYREFVQFHSTRLYPEYLLAYHRK